MSPSAPPTSRPPLPPAPARPARPWADRLPAGLRLHWRVRLHALRARRAGRMGATRIKRLRLAAIVLALLGLGCVSFAFGMFMAVASDLPALEDWQQYRNARNSILLDDHGHPIAVLSKSNQILVTQQQIPRIVKDAVIAIEDKRFYENEGIDIRSMGRALLHDVFGGGGTEGASTIEEQFVKNALRAQDNRTLFEKIREAALAFHLDHRWSKEKIITEYLNTVYFGNGAYGIEAAARTYFGHEADHLGCGTPQRLCVSELKPWEAALLAGMIQSPTDYNPITHPLAARQRRDLVLQQMLQQKYIDRQIYREGISQALPAPADIRPPREQIVEGVDAGYFTSWVSAQVIERYGANAAFDGGLRVKTTLDLQLQRAAEQAVSSYLSNPEGPTASLVAIENSTGDVRAMIGGRNYEQSPFNLATEGERQPGSAFKAFDLAVALEQGISPQSVWPSRMKIFHVPHSKELFIVHNDEGAYTGTNTLTGALTVSDNSIFAEVGIKVGTKNIARLAHRMGITTPISTNYAMTIGGLKVGVTPLDMAHAYETIAHGGQRVSGTLAGARDGPVGIQSVSDPTRTLPDGSHREVNRPTFHRVLPAAIAATETSMMETVIAHGTGTAAAIGQFAAGKTGTTTNYVDAWFVGWDSKYTVAVWVGYPQGAQPMPTGYNGGPVYGGTYPALIWKSFQLAALQIEQERAARLAAAGHGGGAGASAPVAPAGTPSSAGAAEEAGAAPRPSQTQPAAGAGGGGGREHAQIAPAAPPAAGGGEQTPQQQPAAGGGAAPPSTPQEGAPAGEPSSPQPAPSESSATGAAPEGTGGASAPPGGG